MGINKDIEALDRWNFENYQTHGTPAMIKDLEDLKQIAGEDPFGPLTKEEDDDLTERINAAGPDYVWVGLSTPKQDIWAFEHRRKLQAAAVLAVGAAFDFHAGRQKRAPDWMQRAGMEWLFRLLSEPRRLGGRYTITNLRFIGIVCADAIRSLTRRAGKGR